MALRQVVNCGHALPQPPQFATSPAKAASQPFARLMSQSPKPCLHAPTPHCVFTQVVSMFAGAGQAMPHAPQFAGSASSCASQPLRSTLSQLPQPALHAPIVHACMAQAGVAFATLHALPQPPQWLGSAAGSTQRPAQQSVALPQTVAQAPQCATSVARSVHRPP